MDHPGPIARTVRDLSRLFDAIADKRPNFHAALRANGKPCLGVVRGFFHDRADAEVRRVFQAALDTLAAAGAELTEIALPAEFAEVTSQHRAIMGVEAAAWHERRLVADREHYQPRIRELVEEGLTMKGVTYLRAKEARDELRSKLKEILFKTMILIMPATTCPAPDRKSTGDPLFNSPWSYLGLPCLSLPVALSSDGMPVAVQLVGSETVWAECPLFSFAEWCEQVIREANTSTRTPQPI
jgi:Asp-tRNA(Asn)/Glu-tRNA(Gln) amidotransferase A subunit family amidase